MKHLYRIIIYGIILVICIVMGLLGFSEKNRQFSNKKEELTSIISSINNSNYVKNYKENGVIINAKLYNKSILISYQGVNNYNYKFTLGNNYLYAKYNENDAIANMFVMLLADSIGQYYGENEGYSYEIFTNNYYMSSSFNDGIEINNKNGKNYVKINLDEHIKINNMY